MKKVFLYITGLCLTAFLLIACNAVAKDGGTGHTPRSSVPDALVGYWLTGSTSIGNFWDYDGAYKGAGYELATGYLFHKDGWAKQYFYYSSTSTYCRTQVLGYRDGTVVFNTKENTFQFFATDGHSRSYNSCSGNRSPGFGNKKIYSSQDLYPAKKFAYNNWTVVTTGDKTVWRIKMEDGSNMDFEKSIEPQQ